MEGVLKDHNMWALKSFQGNITEESDSQKRPHLDLLLLPSTSGGMRGASERVKKGEEVGGKGRDKTRGRAETEAKSTCQEAPETGFRALPPDVVSFGLVSPSKEIQADEPFFTVMLRTVSKSAQGN
ncbi:hypothetical protein Q7C36_017471 [Tachysurus vachellii]|uniref:Uncharacterized protein n=1 Tax=Tachysurus vachellii TaxID=175792 RepID=A0AA88SEW6_TACVA|nr:hypothetical protein Q7C36_017471 [Tachysurus vachellii]